MNERIPTDQTMAINGVRRGEINWWIAPPPPPATDTAAIFDIEYQLFPQNFWRIPEESAPRIPQHQSNKDEWQWNRANRNQLMDRICPTAAPVAIQTWRNYPDRPESRNISSGSGRIWPNLTKQRPINPPNIQSWCPAFDSGDKGSISIPINSIWSVCKGLKQGNHSDHVTLTGKLNTHTHTHTHTGQTCN